jgi:outer membrane protein TolC
LITLQPKDQRGGIAERSVDYLFKAETPAMNLPVWNGKVPGQLMNPTQFAYVPSLSLGLLDSLYRNVKNYTSAGLAQQNDVLKVQLKQNELKTNMLKLKNGVNMTRRALCQHIGLACDSSLVFTPLADPLIAAIEFQDPDQLVKNRSEYLLLNKAVEVRQVQKMMAVGEYLPQLSVAGAGFTYDVMNNTQNNALGMVSLSIPITDWWAGSHKIKKQEIELLQAENSLLENTEMLALQIRQATNEVGETRFQVDVSQVSVEQSIENLRISQDNYKAGVIVISDLLEAQSVHQVALDNLTEARCNYHVKLTRYLQASGKYNN